MKAAQHAEAIREECLQTRRSLAFETVFSADDKLLFVRRARSLGFFVRLFYIGTDDPAINAARITNRVREGGHDVPITKTISRFDKSLRNLREAITEVERAYVYDNSVENALPALQFRTVRGAVQRVYAKGHYWADALLAEMTHHRAAHEKLQDRGA